MERLVLSKKYPRNFIYSFLPKALNQINTRKINNYKKSDMNKYLSDNYQISICDLIPILKNIRIHEYRSFFILDYDIDGTITNTENKKIHIREVLHLISYGNISTRGLHIIDGTFNYVAENIQYFYHLFILEERAKLESNLKKRI